MGAVFYPVGYERLGCRIDCLGRYAKNRSLLCPSLFNKSLVVGIETVQRGSG